MDFQVDQVPEVEVSIPLDNKDVSILGMLSVGAPSIHEIRKQILVRSPATVYNRLVALEKAGLITSGGYRKNRGRRITKDGLGVLLQCHVIDQGFYDMKVKELESGYNLQFPD